MATVSLGDYFGKEFKFKFLDKKLLGDHGSDVEYNEFLNNTLIINNNRKGRASIAPYLFGSATYVDVIDSLLSYLIDHDSSNCLVNGYKDPSSNSFWSSKVINPSVSFQSNELKNHCWRRVFAIIGTERFCELILTTSCFIPSSGNGLIQLYGVLQKPSETNKYTLWKSAVLHKRKTITHSRLLKGNHIELTASIFSKDNSRSVKRSMGRFKHVCRKLIKNDQHCNYSSIFANMVLKQSSKINSNYDYASSLSEVIKFIHYIVTKVIPLSAWGSKKNKSVILKKVANFIKMGSSYKTTTSDLVSGIKIKDISWLGNSRGTSSKQDHTIRTKLLEEFVLWFFRFFVSKLLNSFWYVTSSPSAVNHERCCNGLLYFPHIYWSELSKNWFSNYIDSNLIEVDPRDVFNVTSIYNVGKLRLVPKSQGFRVLCVPSRNPYGNPCEALKDSSDYKFGYLAHMQQVVRPIQDVLTLKAKEYVSKMEPNLPICHSPIDVSKQINTFKRIVESSPIDTSNGYYIVKFDMRNCYDMLDQKKIIDCIKRIFGNDDNEVYYVRQYAEIDLTKHNLKKVKSEIKNPLSIEDFQTLSFLRGDNSKLCVDKGKTIKLSKSQILEVASKQIYNSCMFTENIPVKFYRRKNGIFQGFPLSATLCDVVYNIMLLDNFESFYTQPDTQATLIRLADDFLVLSTSMKPCQKIMEVMRSESILQYGAHLNDDKTTFITPHSGHQSINFVGLIVDCKTLEVSRDFDLNNSQVSLTKFHSFNQACSYLSTCFFMRLSDYLLDIKSSSFEMIQKNIDMVLGFIFKVLIENLSFLSRREGRIDMRSLERFFNSLFYGTVAKFEKLNQRGAKNEICDVFINRLLVDFGNVCPDVLLKFITLVYN